MEAIKVEELSGIKRKILLNVDGNTVNEQIDEFFDEVKKTAHIKGFRKGKVPVTLLKKQFGEHAKAAVSQSLIVEYYTQALKDHNLNPVGKPTVEGFTPQSKHPGTFEADNSFKAEMVVEVLTEVDPQGYVGLSLDVPEQNTDELVERRMLEYREQFAERTQVTDRPAQLGDSLVIDFKGFMGVNQFEGGSADGFAIDKLGQANFIPGFEDQIVGMNSGETKSIEVTFPENYGASHLAGKKARFEITVHSIVETKLAEVNEDLAMMAGFSTVEELEENIKREVTSIADQQNRGRLEFQITQELLKANDFEIPQALINEEFYRIANQVSGGKVENLQKEVQDALKNTAKMNVQKALLFDAIYEKEDAIEVGPDELEEMLEEHAQKNNKTKDELVSLLYNTNQMDAFMGVLKNKKVVDFIVESANQTESEESNGSNDGAGTDECDRSGDNEEDS